MKTALKWLIVIITSLIFLYAFSASYNSQNMDRLDYVIALGIDSIPESDNLAVSFEFANLGSFSENASSKDTDPIINTIEAPSISTAINIMNAYIGKQLNLSHCKVIVSSKDYAEKGLLSEISVLMHNTQIRPTTNVVISESDAHEYLKNSESSLEQVLTKYYDIFPTTSEYTGYTSNIPLGKFYESLLNRNSGSVAILGQKSKVSTKKNTLSSSQDSSSGDTSMDKTSNSSGEENINTEETNPISPPKDEKSKDVISENEAILEGDRGTENIGLCVFKDERCVRYFIC